MLVTTEKRFADILVIRERIDNDRENDRRTSSDSTFTVYSTQHLLYETYITELIVHRKVTNHYTYIP